MDPASRRRTASREIRDGDLVEVSGLGVYSMREIYAALSSLSSSGVAANGHDDDDDDDNDASSESDSQCSWTRDDEESGSYYHLHQQLTAFAARPDATMTTDRLSRRQRRFVHALAQIMHFGHASLGTHKSAFRSMVLFKQDKPAVSVLSARKPAASQLTTTTRTTIAAVSAASSSASPAGRPVKKRKRVPRQVGGFPCHFGGCEKVFDRASACKKHEQTHQPAYTTQFRCALCGRGFRYDKDLRRHRKVHGPQSAGEDDEEGAGITRLSPPPPPLFDESSSCTDTTAPLSDESEVPSESVAVVRGRLVMSAFEMRQKAAPVSQLDPVLMHGTDWLAGFDPQPCDEPSQYSDFLTSEFEGDSAWESDFLEAIPPAQRY